MRREQLNNPSKYTFFTGDVIMSDRFNDLVRNLPVAKFYYKGRSHTHPVRRTVLVSSQTTTHITGYELREGNNTRTIDDAPVKTYLRSKIATRKRCRSDSAMRNVSKNKLNETTLSRCGLNNFSI